MLSLSPFSLRNSMISSAALPMHYNISYNMRRKEPKRFIKSQLYPKCLFTMEYNDEFVMVRYRKENRLDTVTVKRVRRHTKQNYSDKILSKYLLLFKSKTLMNMPLYFNSKDEHIKRIVSRCPTLHVSILFSMSSFFFNSPFLGNI